MTWYHIRNFIGNLFGINEGKYLAEMMENARCATKFRHLAYYWEQVASGNEPMPKDDADVQRLADNLFFRAMMTRMGRIQMASIESKFVIKDVAIPEDAND